MYNYWSELLAKSIAALIIAATITFLICLPCFLVGWAAINLAIIFGSHINYSGFWHYVFVGLLINIVLGSASIAIRRKK